MSKKLSKALANQKKSVEPYNQKLDGILGITIGGNRKVEVPNRNSYVYVRLRNSQSELIQAFNNKVAPVYNLPVLVERQGNRYVVIDVDTQRYDNNWSSYSPYLPRHGNTHSFDPESGGGGDTVWVHSRQFMPLLAFPSGSVGSPNLIVAPYILKKENGTWMYVGNTGTAGFTPYNPPNSGTAVMGLIALNTDTGNPYLIIGSGSSFSDTITGTSQIYSYIPPLTNPAHIPIAAVRLVSGTNRLTWDNIYDVRQFLHPINTGSAGGLSSIAVQDEAVPQGNATTFDFAGANVSVSISGSVARVYVTGSSSPGGFTGDANAVVLTDGSGNLVTEDWLRYGVAARPYIDLGADVVNKETNAGRIGYNVFSDTMEFFHIVGAGTGVSARRVKIFDELYVDRTAYAREFNINDPSGQYMITGSPHTHINMTIGGRLTTTSQTPVMVGSLAGASVVYWSPYNGQMMPIYDGSKMFVNDIGGELQQTLSDGTKSPSGTSANRNYDMFIWNDQGTYRCTRGYPWATDTTRGTGAGTAELERIQGVYVNKHSITNGAAAQRGTYVGTIRTNASNQVDYIFAGAAAGGTAGVIGIWNMYNRVSISMTVHDTTVSWTFSNSTGTALNPGGTGSGLNNRISYVIGLSEDTVDVSMYARSRTAAVNGAFHSYGIAKDSTSAFSATATVLTLSATAIEGAPPCFESFNGDLGFHFIQMIQRGDGTNTSSMFGGSSQNGMTLRWRA